VKNAIDDSVKDEDHNVFADFYLNKMARALREYHQRPSNSTKFNNDLMAMDPNSEIFTGNPGLFIYKAIAWEGLQNDGTGKNPRGAVNAWKNLETETKESLNDFFDLAKKMN